MRLHGTVSILTVAEMGRADALTIAAGTPGLDLMEKAGAACAHAVMDRWPRQPVLILCGPGNNGGDGFVAARHLRDAGWPVRVALLGKQSSLKGDAAANAERWSGDIEDLSQAVLDGAGVVVDALFGAGLIRPIEGPVRAIVEAINARSLPCLAVDMPSGVDGDTGAILGAAPRADATVTFFRKKPGHLLLPGRHLAGDLIVADIGIPDTVLADIGPRQFENGPDLWLSAFRWPRLTDHKYTRGYAIVAGGANMTGAGRLAARGALRAGAGMVALASPRQAAGQYGPATAAVIVDPIDGPEDFAALVGDGRVSAVLVGPGNGVGDETRQNVLAALGTGKPTVVDADGLTVFHRRPKDLIDAIDGPCVMTPHDGEFRRLFSEQGDRLARARGASVQSGAIIVLKGADTVIAAPDGRAAINTNAPADLATAGAGDVLAGLITGLAAQGMPVFEAACAGCWLHGAAASAIGPGLIADDIPDAIPPVLKSLKRLSRTPASQA